MPVQPPLYEVSSVRNQHDCHGGCIMSKTYLRLTFLFYSLLMTTQVIAGGLSQQQYADLYDLKSMDSQFAGAAKKCIASWGSKSPFHNIGKTRFRVIESGGSLFGMGGDITDSTKTAYPQLIVVNAAANVMGKAYFNFLNPNGWYCLNGNVTVMGKTTITLACKAALANTSNSTIVFGASRGGSNGGTTVMGKTVIKRDCR